MKTLLVRATIVVMLPIMLVWALLARMAREFRHGLHMAWLDMRWEISDARRFWREGTFSSSKQPMKLQRKKGGEE